MQPLERKTISPLAAAERLGISRHMAMYACRTYRKRIQEAGQKGEGIDWTPRPNELECRWAGEGKHVSYQVYADALPLYQASQFDSGIRGWRAGRPRKKRVDEKVLPG